MGGKWIGICEKCERMTWQYTEYFHSLTPFRLQQSGAFRSGPTKYIKYIAEKCRILTNCAMSIYEASYESRANPNNSCARKRAMNTLKGREFRLRNWTFVFFIWCTRQRMQTSPRSPSFACSLSKLYVYDKSPINRTSSLQRTGGERTLRRHFVWLLNSLFELKAFHFVLLLAEPGKKDAFLVKQAKWERKNAEKKKTALNP